MQSVSSAEVAGGIFLSQQRSLNKKKTLTVRKFGLSTQKINIYQYSFFSSTSLNWIKQRCELFSQTSQIMTNIAGKL